MLGSTTCSDWLITLLAYSSGKLKYVSVLVLALFTIVFFNLVWFNVILHSRRTKSEIDTGNNIDYDVKSYQVKKTIVKSANTKTATSFSFPELHANKLINQSLHIVDLNIDRYDMIIGRDLIICLGIDIHVSNITAVGMW